MLSLLHIENIALIQSADIVFEAGFNVLTGETGAGKSIVIDAIGALMGERTSRDLIRTGEKTARVSGVFCALPPLPWFSSFGIGPDENGELHISRQLQTDGKNICRVNGNPCTVVQLKALGNQLLNLHGQHDGQQLLDERSHLLYLDQFGGIALEAYTALYGQWMSLQQELSGIQMDEREKTRRMDTLQFQIGELERADLKAGEDIQLIERIKMLRNADKLMTALEGAYIALFGDENREGADSLLAEAEKNLTAAGHFSEEVRGLGTQFTALRYTVEDLTERVRDLRDELDVSTDELNELERRQDTLYRLKKYGNTVEEMLQYLSRCRSELEDIESSEDKIASLKEKIARVKEKTQAVAEKLSEERKAVAGRLKAEIETELRQLDMPKVRFETEFVRRTEPGQNGYDEVQFLMSANLGESLKPIQRVASGGELSRIMLALKNVLAETDQVTTLIFDEVDAGVSGRAAQKVAEKMATLALRRQVLCVTHLPQLAAMADAHFSVQKNEHDGRTHTFVAVLDREQRKQELARLTGGSHMSVAILEGAEELLAQAEQYKHPKSKPQSLFEKEQK
ncbi:MAG: DNA repair protein RecN [Evtepia sp.]